MLDVACGRGRHSLFLARRGCRVHAIDRDLAALVHLQQSPIEGAGSISTACIDLEAGEVSLGSRRYAGVIVFNYLHRLLMPAIVEAVASGGVLIYETFTSEQAVVGHPRNPAFLLQPGELRRLVKPLGVVDSREGEFGGKFVASVVALR